MDIAVVELLKRFGIDEVGRAGDLLGFLGTADDHQSVEFGGERVTIGRVSGGGLERQGLHGESQGQRQWCAAEGLGGHFGSLGCSGVLGVSLRRAPCSAALRQHFNANTNDSQWRKWV